MQTAILTALLLGAGLLGGSMITPNDVDLIDERVGLVVEDPARAAAAEQVLDELRREVEHFNEVFVDAGNRLSDLYRDHAAGSLQMQQTLETLNLEWYASQNRSVKLRTRLKESISADEWGGIFDAK